MQFRAHVQEFIDKFRYNAKRASLVQSKIKMLEKLWVVLGMVGAVGKHGCAMFHKHGAKNIYWLLGLA